MSLAIARPPEPGPPQTAPGALIGAAVDGLDDHLQAVLDREAERWAAVHGRLDEPLELLGGYVAAGGKRLRPTFFLCGYAAAGGDPRSPAALDAAAALELLHAFALLHDDVIDGSDRRRGRPAMHVALAAGHRHRRLNGDARRFGEGVAVLVGDLALTCAERLIGALCLNGPQPNGPQPAGPQLTGVGPAAAGAAAAVRAVWDELRTELVMGEYLDVAVAAEGRATPGEALVVARYKSGAYTVERPLHLGAALAGRLDDLGPAFSAFGQPLGEAFQLRDDVLGVFGAEAVTGKPVGEDLREGKQTLLLGLARQMAGPADQPLLDRVGAPDLAPGEVAAIAALLDRCGARRAVEHQIERRYRAALEALAAAPLDGPARCRLGELAERSLWRAA